MSTMVTNEKLKAAVKDPFAVNKEEISHMAAEILRDRAFIQRMMMHTVGDKQKSLPAAKDPMFYRSLLAVSTGTLASLTGVTNYILLDRIFQEFAIYYLTHQDIPYHSWMDVWTPFWSEWVREMEAWVTEHVV